MQKTVESGKAVGGEGVVLIAIRRLLFEESVHEDAC